MELHFSGCAGVHRSLPSKTLSSPAMGLQRYVVVGELWASLHPVGYLTAS